MNKPALSPAETARQCSDQKHKTNCNRGAAEWSEGDATGIQMQTGLSRALHAYRAKTAIPLGHTDLFLDGF